MAKKKPQKNTAHKKAIERTADELAKKGWQVEADHLSKYPDPPVVNGRRPDILASKNGWYRIYEVETGRGDDLDQRIDLFQYAKKSNNIRFITITLDKAGKRRQAIEVKTKPVV